MSPAVIALGVVALLLNTVTMFAVSAVRQRPTRGLS
jgi:hypothetical protein